MANYILYSVVWVLYAVCTPGPAFGMQGYNKAPNVPRDMRASPPPNSHEPIGETPPPVPSLLPAVRLRIFCVHTALQLWEKRTVKRTGIIENPAWTLELPLLVRSVGPFSFYLSQLRAERESFRQVFSLLS